MITTDYHLYPAFTNYHEQSLTVTCNPLSIIQNLPSYIYQQSTTNDQHSYGTAIASKISSTIFSEVIFSASASYVNPILWRITSLQMAFTSSGIT